MTNDFDLGFTYDEQNPQKQSGLITKQNIARFALGLAVIIISYLVFSRPSYPQGIPHLDKVGHLGSFFGLTLLSYLAFRPKWYQIVASLGAYALLIELVQAKLPYRSASTADFIADMLGVTLFYGLLWLYRKYQKTQSNSATSATQSSYTPEIDK